MVCFFPNPECAKKESFANETYSVVFVRRVAEDRIQLFCILAGEREKKMAASKPKKVELLHQEKEVSFLRRRATRLGEF
jgi:hypothetical protein